ncbi:MAG: hypothetical protein KF729_20160 [Sandaracinaceae bacterium]|nr:hypothetical protein [Sandaracinaceae bacterium]
MLTREIMGLLALGVLWVNGLLVLAVALKQLRAVIDVRARFRRAREERRLSSGVVAEGEPFAVRHVAQLGRAITTRGPARILFTDGPQSFEVLGGVLETPEGPVRVAPAPPGLSEVWIAPERAAEAHACPSAEVFDEAFGEASKYKGYRREVLVSVRAGDRVWVVGDRGEQGVVPREDEPLLVSMVEPFGWTAQKARLLVGFVVLSLVGLVGVSALALWSPWFGTISTIGGALCVAYFLAIQPLGTAVRDAVRTPARQPIGGSWRRA